MPSHPSTRRSQGTDADAPNRQTKPSKFIPASTSTTLTTRRVQFVETGAFHDSQRNEVADPRGGGNAIEDFCEVLALASAEPRNTRLGYLDPLGGTRLWLQAYPPPSSLPNVNRMAKLNSFISSTLSREARMRAGLSMLVTLLVIGPTPWLSSLFLPDWDRSTAGDYFLVGPAEEETEPDMAVFLPYSSQEELFRQIADKCPEAQPQQHRRPGPAPCFS